MSLQRQTQFEVRHGGPKVYLPLESVLPLPGHKQQDFRGEELGGSGSRVQQLATKFSENERDVKKATKRPPITAIESGHVSGSSSLNLPAELRRGMQTEDLVEEQKKLLAAAARNKKEKGGQPAGSASSVDNSRRQHEDSLYVQRQQQAILEKTKSQETHPGKSNTESLPNQKGANHRGFGSMKRPQAAQNDGEYEVVQWPPKQASATDSHSMRYHDHDQGGIHLSYTNDLDIDSAVQVRLNKGELVYGTIRWIGKLVGEIYAGIELVRFFFSGNNLCHSFSIGRTYCGRN